MPYGDGRYAVPEGTPGAVWLRGRVFDGEGAPVPDALVESWQADVVANQAFVLAGHPQEMQPRKVVPGVDGVEAGFGGWPR